MSLLQTPVSLVDGIAEESLRFKESFAVVCIPLRSMRGTWTTSTICNYDEDRMHLRRLPETSLMQPVTEPTAASRLNSRPSACGFDARNAFTTAPADFAFGAVSSCPSFYRGEQYDADLGLYYLRARYYNPNTGRFMSRDPEDGHSWDPASLHKYLYANGDPVNGIDPQGHEALLGYAKGLIRAVVQAKMTTLEACKFFGALAAFIKFDSIFLSGDAKTFLSDLGNAYAAVAVVFCAW